MVLKDEIKKLMEVQEIDYRVYNLNQQKNEKPEQIQKIKNELEEKKKKFLALDAKFKDLQLKKKDRELNLASKEENIKKTQGQLYQLKSNKDYQAKLTEIASLKADVSILEEDVLMVMGEIEEATGKLQEEKKNIANEEKLSQAAEAKVVEEVKNIDIEIQALIDKRGILIKGVDKSVFDRYETLLASRAGLAITFVKDGSCGACHMRVNHQTINEIKMYKGLVFCESCSRILCIEEENNG